MNNLATNTPKTSPSPEPSTASKTPVDKAPVDKAAADLKTSLVAGAHDIGEEMKHLAGDAATLAKKNAESQIDAGKTRAVESLESVAHALRTTGEQLRAEKCEGYSKYIDTAAQKVDTASHYLKDSSFSDVVGDVEDFARREPALFLGGALVVGLIGGRFLKASGPQGQSARRPGSKGNGQGPRRSGTRNRDDQGQLGFPAAKVPLRRSSPHNGGGASEGNPGGNADTANKSSGDV